MKTTKLSGQPLMENGFWLLDDGMAIRYSQLKAAKHSFDSDSGGNAKIVHITKRGAKTVCYRKDGQTVVVGKYGERI